MVAPRPEHQEIRTGAFVIVALIAILAGAMSLPAILGPKMKAVSIQFPFREGVTGIASGTPILLGGLRIGEVNTITFVPASGDDLGHFLAACSFDPEMRIPPSATVTVQQSAIGAGPKLIVQLPAVSQTDLLVPDDQKIVLQVTPSQSTLEFLLGEERAAALEKSGERMQALHLSGQLHDGVERLRTAANDAGSLKAEFSNDWEVWRAQANSIGEGYDAASTKRDEILALFGPGKTLDREKLEPAFERIKTNLSSSVELTATLRTRWNEQILPPLTDLIDRFKKDCAIIERDYALTMNALNDGKGAWASSKADLQIAGVQLNRAVREITLMPWTLLGGTFADKGEQAQFNTMAQEIVRSTAELHMAVSFAQELLDQDPKLAVRYPELVELLNRWMTRAAAKHEVAGQKILDRLIGPAAH